MLSFQLRQLYSWDIKRKISSKFFISPGIVVEHCNLADHKHFFFGGGVVVVMSVLFHPYVHSSETGLYKLAVKTDW